MVKSRALQEEGLRGVASQSQHLCISCGIVCGCPNCGGYMLQTLLAIALKNLELIERSGVYDGALLVRRSTATPTTVQNLGANGAHANTRHCCCTMILRINPALEVELCERLVLCIGVNDAVEGRLMEKREMPRRNARSKADFKRQPLLGFGLG